MTYREKIQELIERIDSVYDDAGWLRDQAMLHEKKYWNELREHVYKVRRPLRELDDELSDFSSNREILP